MFLLESINATRSWSTGDLVSEVIRTDEPRKGLPRLSAAA